MQKLNLNAPSKIILVRYFSLVTNLNSIATLLRMFGTSKLGRQGLYSFIAFHFKIVFHFEIVFYLKGGLL